MSLPAVVPRGPVALLGLGAGTAAHLMLKFYPWLQLVGWEIDPKIIELSRDYFGLSDLEKATESGGSLSVRIGDALSPSAIIEGGFAVLLSICLLMGRSYLSYKKLKPGWKSQKS